MPGDPETSGRSYTAEILLISFAALLLEISYTRIVSYKLFYYYTYLVIGLALLGIGSGGVMTLCMILVIQLTSKKRRGLWIGLTNAVRVA